MISLPYNEGLCCLHIIGSTREKFIKRCVINQQCHHKEKNKYSLIAVLRILDNTMRNCFENHNN